MNQTQLSLYRNSARMLVIEIFQVNEKQQLRNFEPASATIKIIDNETDEVVLSETAAGVSINKAFYLINANNFTNRVGQFKVIWKISKGSEIFFHKTYIELQEL